MHYIDKSNIFYLKKDDFLYFCFFDKITASYSFSLKKYLNSLLTNNKKIKKIYIDLSKCTYIDSTSIGTLIYIHNLAESLNAKLVLFNIPAKINKIMENANLKRFFNIREDNNLLDFGTKLNNYILPDKKITSDFILDSHKNILKIAPDLKEEFCTILELLNNEKN